MSDQKISMIIELVQERPVLWQKSHPSYKDSRRVKRNNWEDVSRIVNEKFVSDLTGSNNYTMIIIIIV